jgi:cell division protein FtsL
MIKKKYTLLLGLLSVVFIINIFIAIKSGISGGELIELESQAQKLEEDNQKLKENLISLDSLTKVQEFSKQNGMIKPQNIVYLNAESAVAKLP